MSDPRDRPPSDHVAALEVRPGREKDLAFILLDALPVDGASVATIGGFLGAETVSASDRTAARIDEIQFDLGEGPSWDALGFARPVSAPDIRGASDARWPLFTQTVREWPVSALFAFPLVIGPLKIGAIDLYSEHPTELTGDHAEQVASFARVVSRVVMNRALSRAGTYDPDDDGGPFSRRIVHQATGVVLAQLDISAEDARLVIEGHAFASNQPVRDVAGAIVDGDLDFSRQPNGFEGSDD